MNAAPSRRHKTFRASRASKSQSPFARIHDDMISWCSGRTWWLRAPFLIWFLYILARLVQDPGYEPIFKALDLGIHELGHIIWEPFGQYIAILGGSLTQLLVPAGSAYMFYRQRDHFAIVFCFGWFGVNLFDVANYVADARSRTLRLVSPFSSDPLHDWNYLLSKIGLLEASHLIAFLMRTIGTASILLFVCLGAYQCWLMVTLPKKSIE